MQSVRCAGIELGLAHRRGIVNALDGLRDGGSLSFSLPRQSLFRRGFEPEFLGFVRVGEEYSVLPAALRLAAGIRAHT
jgi:hypothetical protein